MTAQFILENLHFGLNLFSALVFFAVSWLYLDAWFAKKSLKDSLKITGFTLISLSFILHSTHLEQGLIASSVVDAQIGAFLYLLLRASGYIFIIIGISPIIF